MLAIFSLHHPLGLHVFEEPPSMVTELLVHDEVGVVHPRLVLV